MSKFLAIDTSSKHLTVLAVNGERSETEYLENCAMRHSVILMDKIDCVLKRADLSPSECDFFAVVTGPGSFTGIRIGIATAKGFAAALNKPVKPITAFNLLSYNIGSGKFFTAIDAAHDYYYVCGFENGREILAPSYLPKDEVAALTPLYGFEALPFENYTRLNADECLYAAALRAECVAPENLHALYIRKSQAEENRK